MMHSHAEYLSLQVTTHQLKVQRAARTKVPGRVGSIDLDQSR